MALNVQEALKVAEEAARAGAHELMAWRGRFTFRKKARHDLVTEADVASERAIRGIIADAYPSHGVLGEEAPIAKQLDMDYCWVVDPLDGTTNYVHDFPCYGVSVALAHAGRLLVGLILDPLRQECFAAAVGAGATLNGQAMATTSATEIGESLLAASFPANLAPDAPDLEAFVRLAPMCQAMRRTGSAALNLAYVACGRLDGHWAHQTHPWDSAAGILLVQEAGGVATGSDGRPFQLAAGDYLAASTAALHTELLAVIQTADR